MSRLAHCIAALLLALFGSSCLATSAVVEWAWEPEVRTEVLGYVESDLGASLIVTFHEAALFEDGTYELPMVRSHARHLGDVAPARVAARLLRGDEIAEFRTARGKSRRVGHLPGTGLWYEASCEHVDAYRRSREGLLRLGPDRPSVHVALESNLKDLGRSTDLAAQRALVVVLRREPGSRHSRVLGIVAIPPPAISGWRGLLAVVVLPATVVFDVATAPLQVMVASYSFGRALERVLVFRHLVVTHASVYAVVLPAYVPVRARHWPVLAVPNAANPLLTILAGLAEVHRVKLTAARAIRLSDVAPSLALPPPAN